MKSGPPPTSPGASASFLNSPGSPTPPTPSTSRFTFFTPPYLNIQPPLTPIVPEPHPPEYFQSSLCDVVVNMKNTNVNSLETRVNTTLSLTLPNTDELPSTTLSITVPIPPHVLTTTDVYTLENSLEYAPSVASINNLPPITPISPPIPKVNQSLSLAVFAHIWPVTKGVYYGAPIMALPRAYVTTSYHSRICNSKAFRLPLQLVNANMSGTLQSMVCGQPNMSKHSHIVICDKFAGLCIICPLPAESVTRQRLDVVASARAAIYVSMCGQMKKLSHAKNNNNASTAYSTDAQLPVEEDEERRNLLLEQVENDPLVSYCFADYVHATSLLIQTCCNVGAAIFPLSCISEIESSVSILNAQFLLKCADTKKDFPMVLPLPSTHCECVETCACEDQCKCADGCLCWKTASMVYFDSECRLLPYVPSSLVFELFLGRDNEQVIKLIQKTCSHVIHVSTKTLSRAPRWLPDHASDKCLSCHREFGLLSRKHHCRACGILACGQCCGKTAVLPDLGYKEPVRVCVKCHMLISNYRATSGTGGNLDNLELRRNIPQGKSVAPIPIGTFKFKNITSDNEDDPEDVDNNDNNNNALQTGMKFSPAHNALPHTMLPARTEAAQKTDILQTELSNNTESIVPVSTMIGENEISLSLLMGNAPPLLALSPTGEWCLISCLASSVYYDSYGFQCTLPVALHQASSRALYRKASMLIQIHNTCNEAFIRQTSTVQSSMQQLAQDVHMSEMQCDESARKEALVLSNQVETHQVKKWQKFLCLQSTFDRRHPELRNLVMNGIPTKLRQQIWIFLLESNLLKKHYDSKVEEEPLSTSDSIEKTVAIVRRWRNNPDMSVEEAMEDSYYPHACRLAEISTPPAGKYGKRYEQLLRHCVDLEYRVVIDIEKDISRTMQTNAIFQTSEGITSFRRILVAYAVQKPIIGYCQSMNFIAALFFCVIKQEEFAFWSLSCLVEGILLLKLQEITDNTLVASSSSGSITNNNSTTVLSTAPSTGKLSTVRIFYHQHDLLGSRIDCQLISGIVTAKLPRVANIQNQFGLSVSEQCIPWILPVFVEVLPIQTLLNVWDYMLYDGAVVIIRVAVALFKIRESTILEANDIGSLMQMLDMSDITWDVLYNVLISSLCKRITLEYIEEKRRVIYISMQESIQASATPRHAPSLPSSTNRKNRTASDTSGFRSSEKSEKASLLDDQEEVPSLLNVLSSSSSSSYCKVEEGATGDSPSTTQIKTRTASEGQLSLSVDLKEYMNTCNNANQKLQQPALSRFVDSRPPKTKGSNVIASTNVGTSPSPNSPVVDLDQMSQASSHKSVNLNRASDIITGSTTSSVRTIDMQQLATEATALDIKAAKEALDKYQNVEPEPSACIPAEDPVLENAFVFTDHFFK